VASSFFFFLVTFAFTAQLPPCGRRALSSARMTVGLMARLHAPLALCPRELVASMPPACVRARYDKTFMQQFDMRSFDMAKAPGRTYKYVAAATRFVVAPKAVGVCACGVVSLLGCRRVRRLLFVPGPSATVVVVVSAPASCSGAPGICRQRRSIDCGGGGGGDGGPGDRDGGLCGVTALWLWSSPPPPPSSLHAGTTIPLRCSRSATAFPTPRSPPPARAGRVPRPT
jgi:hypothetical protein